MPREKRRSHDRKRRSERAHQVEDSGSRLRNEGRVRGPGGQGPLPVRLHELQRPEEEREAHEETCRETWATVWGLEGDTLEEARQALAESRFRGAAYHLSDCQLLEDRPVEDTTPQS